MLPYDPDPQIIEKSLHELEFPDAKRQELGMFGYVTDDGGMEAIWNGKEYSRLLQDHMKYPLCMSCNMRRPTGKVCIHD